MDGRTDKHDATNSGFSQRCERTRKCWGIGIFSSIEKQNYFSTTVTDKHDGKCEFRATNTRFYIPTNDLKKSEWFWRVVTSQYLWSFRIVALVSFLPKSFHSCVIHTNKMLERKESGVSFSGITFTLNVIQERNLIQTLFLAIVILVDIQKW